MSYLDFSRFIHSIPEPLTKHNTVILDDFAYRFGSPGFRIFHESDRYADLNFDSVWKLDVHVSDYTFALQQLKDDFVNIVNNPQKNCFISISNYLDNNFEDVYQIILNWIPHNNKKIYLEFYHCNIHKLELPKLNTDKLKDYKIKENIEVIDIHYSGSNKTYAYQLYPEGKNGEY